MTNMRKFLNLFSDDSKTKIVESKKPFGFIQSLNEGMDINRVRHELARNFWHKVSDNRRYETWMHMDDPSIGSYDIAKNRNGSIKSIEYTSKLHSIFNRSFDTFGQFLQHVITTTEEDDPTPDQIIASHEKMKKIADDLKDDEDDEYN